LGADTKRIIVWMRRALRVEDNTPLWHAAQEGGVVIPVVVLRDEERYRRDTPRRRFIRGALGQLDEGLRSRGSCLVCLRGDPEKEIPALARAVAATDVFAVTVYDPETLGRDARLGTELERHGIRWKTFKDCVLLESGETVKNDGTPYTVYTPFRNAWQANIHRVLEPLPTVIALPPVEGIDKKRTLPAFDSIDNNAGERMAHTRLRIFLKERAMHYHEFRDMPGVAGTSQLSADLAHGTISIRRVFRDTRLAVDAVRGNTRRGFETFMNELIWREFYYQILSAFPYVTRRSFKTQMDGIRWSADRSHFAAWCEGRTGYPIVDAGMRQLLAEGWMHNRVRMIVASFLTKDLHINWQWGEQHFLEHLIDADIASNNGGWQWTAGTGTDASPWFRIFNPVLQAEKFDPSGEYVRRYVPELRTLPNGVIHKPWGLPDDEQKSAGVRIGVDYPAPLVDHARERETTMRLYREATDTVKRRPTGKVAPRRVS
jgi:deoxyribodipyrimidine photo-lyase